MALKRIRRKLFLTLASIFLTLLVCILASPLWFPWILRPIAARYGAHFSGFERDGYGRLVLTDVSYAHDKVTFRASHVEVLQPINWGWRYFANDHLANFAALKNWDLTIMPGKPPAKHLPVFALAQRQESLLHKLKQWLPVAELRDGIIRSGTNDLQIPAAIWKDGILTGDIIVSKFHTVVTYKLNVATPTEIRLTAGVPTFEIEANLIAAQSADALTIVGDLLWRTNRAKLSVVFAPESILPRTASVVAESVRISSKDLGVRGYDDLRGSLSAIWNGTNFSVDISAKAAGETNTAPPIHALVQARGDTNAIQFETLSVSLPWAQAALSTNVEVSFHGKLLSATAAFKASADLANQPFFPATGLVAGELFLKRGEKQFPDGTFKLWSRNLQGFGVEYRDVLAEGSFSWPELKINHLGFRFAEGGTVTSSGAVDIEKQFVHEAVLQLSGAIPSRFRPRNIDYKNVRASLKLNGPLRKLSHEGTLELSELMLPQLRPLRASARWQGQSLDLKTINATISAGSSVLRFAGASIVSTNRLDVQVRELTLVTNGKPALTLQQSSKLLLEKKGTNWGVAISPLRLHGTAGAFSATADVEWPQRGTFALAADHLQASLVQDFFRQPLADGQLNLLRASGGWTNSPISFSANGSGSYRLQGEPPISIRVKAAGNPHGVQFGEFLVTSGYNQVITATGKLPLRLEPLRQREMVQLDFKEQIQFHATTKTNTALWDHLAKAAKLKLQQPEILLDISGSLEKPTARISVHAASLEYTGATRPIPRLGDLRADIRADREWIRVESLQFKVEGEPVLVRAQMPLGKISTNWKQLFDWRKGSGAIVIQKARVAPFIPYMPAVLMPSGSLDLNVTVSPGLRVNGDLLLQGLETRSFGTIGSLHDLRAQLKFTESLVQFTNVTGVLGGETIGVSGFINFAEATTNKLPLFDLNIAGKAVPLTRKPDLILRADIELNALNTRTNRQPVVSGLVNFNDGFFLGDLKMLLPGKVTKPRDRPPFFSVDAEPFAKWDVNLRVVGEKFLKVRTPLFRGTLSSNLRIRGTLREPIALGDARIESGQVQFPFANLRVQQGFLSLTSDDPYRPHIFATAASRTFGYDVQMTLSGLANKPLVEFSSTPPLTSEQVVLMMTAGELPKRETSFSTEQRAGRLALFLGKSILSKFTSDEGGAERLSVTSGENITEQGKQTYSVEYKITEDVSLVGEYDRFGAWNAGVKWRVYSK